MRLDFVSAFKYNPLFVTLCLVGMVVFFALIIDFIKHKKITLRLKGRALHILLAFVIIILVGFIIIRNISSFYLQYFYV